MGARVLAGASGLFWMLIFMGLIDLAVPVEQTPGFYEAYLLETGWGVLFTFLVGGAFVSLAARPKMVMPLLQVVIVAACVAAAALAAGSWVQLAPAVLLAANSYFFALLERAHGRLAVPWYRSSVDPVVGAVAVVLVPPAAWFAVDMVNGYRQGRPPLDDDTWWIDHWPMQAALALAVAGLAIAVAAGVCGRWSGTAVSAGCVSGAAGWFGYWSATYPSHAGSAGRVWGVALVGWAVAFMAVVGWRLVTRHAPQGDPR